MDVKVFLEQIEQLTGTPIKMHEREDYSQLTSAIARDDALIDSSQFNELLLMVNKDRVSTAFFNLFFCDCDTDEEAKTCKVADIPAGIEHFKKAAMLRYGNFIFAYRRLSRTSAASLSELLSPLDRGPAKLLEAKLALRNPPLVEVQRIARNDTYLIGYISPREIVAENERSKELLAAMGNEKKLDVYRATAKKTESPARGEAEALLRLYDRLTIGVTMEEAKATMGDYHDRIKQEHDRLIAVRGRGIQNTDTYLSWDHMDVYFATSMRQRWEYEDLFDFVEALVHDTQLQGLNLRYFDPTQSFEENRIDKGLVEALMLKRAACTVYSIQDTDTLGKDSELAATLAQGKPVIAYAPKVDINQRAAVLEKEHPSVLRARSLFVTGSDEGTREKFASDPLRGVMKALDGFEQQRIWKSIVDTDAVDAFVRGGHDIKALCYAIAQAERTIYDRRAQTLQQNHPLGIQVNLDTGVANGVLVARDIPTCAKLIRRIVTNSMQFDVIDDEKTKSWHLVERETGSIFRVVTRNPKLTNAFWNFYRSEADKGGRNVIS